MVPPDLLRSRSDNGGENHSAACADRYVKVVIFSKLQSTFTVYAQKLGLSDDMLSVLMGAGVVMVVQIGSAALNYVSQILLARWMGPSEYGVYVFAWSWAMPLAIAAAIGLAAAAVRFVPQYMIKDDWGPLHGLIRRSTAIVLGTGIAVAAAGAIILELLGGVLPGIYVDPTRLALLCVPFLTLIVLLSGVSRGFGWVGLAFVPQALLIPGLFVVGVGCFALLVRPPTSVPVLIIAFWTTVVVAIVHSYAFRREIPKNVRTAEPTYETRTWLRVAIPLFLADGVFLVLWNVDMVMIGSLLKPEDVAIYYASVKTAALTCLVFNAVRAFAAPKFAALFVSESREEQQHFARQIAVWTLWPTILVAIVVVLAGKWVLSTFGASFVSGYPVLLVLTAGYLTRAATGPLSAYLSVSGHQDDMLYANAGAAILNVIFNALLIPLFGILGAAIASVLAVVSSQAWLFVLVKRRLGINGFFLGRS